MSEVALSPNPYVGPRAFEEREAHRFFGRERELEDLFHLLISRRLVLLHSPSGAGKSSLIQAALIPRLRAEGFIIHPTIRVGTEASAGTGANRFTYATLLALDEGRSPDERLPVEELTNLTLDAYLAQRHSPDTEEVFIFDQFEEILNADTNDRVAKEVFFKQLGEMLDNPRRWALFALREDALGMLKPFLLPIPTRLSTTFRLDLLNPEQAQQAIRGPALGVGAEFSVRAAQRLTDDLRRTRVQRTDGKSEEVLGQVIDPVQLQVVCYRLWERKQPDSSADIVVLAEADIEVAGNVDLTLADYYTERVATIAAATATKERVIRDWIEGQLITGDLRGQVLREPGKTAGLNNQVIQSLVDAHMVRAEARRSAIWYELAHDRLVAPVRASNAAWRIEHLSILQQKSLLWDQQRRPPALLLNADELREASAWAKEHVEEIGAIEQEFLSASQTAQAAIRREQLANRRIRWLAVVASVISIIAVMLAVFALSARDEAERQRREAVQQRGEADRQAQFARTAEAEADKQRTEAQAAAQQANTSAAEAEDAFQRALEVARFAANSLGDSSVYYRLGEIYLEQGRDEDALEVFEAALAYQQGTENRAEQGGTLTRIGQIYLDKESYNEALIAFETALKIYEDENNFADQGATLVYIGVVYQHQSRLNLALGVFLKALPIVRGTDDYELEASILRGLGGIYQAQGQYDKAQDYYQQMLVLVQEEGNLTSEGFVLNNLGIIYSKQGQYAQALEAFQQALAIARETVERSEEGSILHNLGMIYRDQGQYAQALEAFQQALTIAHETGDRSEEGSILHNLGMIYRDQGQYAQALEAFQQALTIARAEGNQPSEVSILHNLGVIYQEQGRYTQALDAFQQALAIARALGDRYSEAAILNKLGFVYRTRGQYGQATMALQQQLVLARASGDRQSEGNALTYLGVVYQVQGQYDEALEYYQTALVVYREVTDPVGELVTLNNMGSLYRTQEHYNQALTVLQQALTIAHEIGFRAQEGSVLTNIGSVYQAQERYDEALDVLQQALALARMLDNRSSESTTLTQIGSVYQAQERYDEALDVLQQALALARELGDRANEGAALTRISAVYESQGHLDQALSTYQQAMDVIEALRATISSEQGRLGFSEQYKVLYERASAVAHIMGQDELAFALSERGRARAFLDSLATGTIQFSDQEIQSLLEREQETYAAREAAEVALAKARAASPPDTALIDDLEQQVADAEQAHNDALQAIESRGGQLEALVPSRSRSVLDVPAVQQLLDSRTTLVEYQVLDNLTLAFVLTHDSFHTIALPVKRGDLVAQVQELRAFANLSESIPASASQLYDALIAPLKPGLTTSHLAIVPNDVLHYLPFAALSDGQSVLIDDYDFTILPSASSLPFVQNNTGRKSTQILVLGNPTTTEPGLPPVFGAEQEARAIANLYGVEPLLKTAATESALRRQAHEAGIIHIAAHSSFNPANPFASTIYLATDPNNITASQDDGRLETGEIYSLDLQKADLVVLSAAETQLGQLSAGDDLLSMTRAFLFAGTPSVIASLWSVDDEATSLLMQRFYTHLKSGMSKAAALRHAQLDVREQYPNPYYWAGFVLTGDPGQEQLPALPWWAWLIISTSLLTLFLGGIAIWHKNPKNVTGLTKTHSG